MSGTVSGISPRMAVFFGKPADVQYLMVIETDDRTPRICKFVPWIDLLPGCSRVKIKSLILGVGPVNQFRWRSAWWPRCTFWSGLWSSTKDVDEDDPHCPELFVISHFHHLILDLTAAAKLVYLSQVRYLAAPALSSGASDELVGLLNCVI